MKVDVSIIVPVYNVEKYLPRCVASLRAQTLADIEIILVDDGSPDGCPQMCDRFAAEDARIRVVHKANGGLSSARNAGIDAAAGQYLGFVDSDDAVSPDMYEKMVAAIEKDGTDFVMSDYIRVPSEAPEYLKTTAIAGGVYSKADIRETVFPALIMGPDLNYGPLLSVWHCLYRADFLKRNNLRFENDVRWSEDNIFSAEVGYCADSFTYLKGEGLYRYYQNPGTITTSYRPAAWDVYCTMNRKLHAYFGSKTDYDFTNQLKLHIIFYACFCINQTAYLQSKERIRVIKSILSSEILSGAFNGLDKCGMNRKLRTQLWLMRHKCSRLLSRFVARR